MSSFSRLENRLRKEVGDGFLLPADGKVEEGLSTGLLTLNMALSGNPKAGLVQGRIAEIYGPEMSGKTTLALTLLKQAQKAEMPAAFVDMEHALDLDYMRALGIDRNELSVAQPDCGEDAVKLVEAMIETGYRFVVVDSVAAMTPKSELDGEPGDAHMGRLARLMGQAIRKLSVKVSRTNGILIFVNQIRARLGTLGAGETTPGGLALKFGASYRIDVRAWRRGKRVKDGVEVGIDTEAKIVKNKLYAPHRVAKLRLVYGEGFDVTYDLLEHLFSKNTKVKVDSQSYTRKGMQLLLARNRELRDRLRDKLC